MTPFKLINFETGESQISGFVSVHEDVLTVQFKFLSQGIIVPGETPQGREDKLWEQTCFEIFLGHLGTNAYGEFNFSPSKKWNFFIFQDYRKDRESPPWDVAPPFIEYQDNGEAGARLTVQINLGPLKPLYTSGSSILGLSSVLDHENGRQSFHALKHLSDQPDFHLKDSFLIRI